MLCIIIIISIICVKHDFIAVLQARAIEFWMVISSDCFLKSRFVERVWGISTQPLWSSDHSNPLRPDLVILGLSLSRVPWCSLASLQRWQFFNRFGSLLLDLIVLVMTLPSVWAKNKFPAVVCAYCYLFCLINC